MPKRWFFLHISRFPTFRHLFGGYRLSNIVPILIALVPMVCRNTRPVRSSFHRPTAAGISSVGRGYSEHAPDLYERMNRRYAAIRQQRHWPSFSALSWPWSWCYPCTRIIHSSSFIAATRFGSLWDAYTIPIPTMYVVTSRDEVVP